MTLDLRDQTILKIKEIERSLRPFADHPSQSLHGGTAGLSLFYYQYNKFFCTEESERIFTEIIENIIKSFGTEDKYLTFSNGTIGKLFLLAYYANEEIIDASIFPDDMVNIIGEFALKEITSNNYDILHGGLGALMFLNEIPHKSVQLRTEIVKQFLNKLSVENNLNLWVDYFKGDKNFNLGLAHGNPGYCSLLSNCRDLETLVNISLIERILDSINHFRLTNATSLYPYSNVEGESGSRLAWCYGDLGVASAFWQSGKKFKINSWKEEAINILKYNLSRKGLEENHVRDAGLCHGSAGIAHIYNRFFHETKNKEFEQFRNYWVEKTLEFARFEDGIAGYKSFHMGNYILDHSFLEGVTGIGLALISCLSNDINDLSWDRAIFLN